MSKKTLILGGIFIALLIVAFVYDPILRWKDSLNKPDNFLSAMKDFDEANKMEVKKDGVVVVLEKDSKGWRVSSTKDFYVADDLVATIKNNLKDAAEGDMELVSDNGDRKNDFETGDNGVEVKIFKDDSLLSEFVVGKAGYNYTSSYVSRVGGDETFLINSNLNVAFAHDDWYDKTIFNSDPESVSKIRFQYPTREFTVERTITDVEGGEKEFEDWTGTLPYKFDVDQDKVEEVLDVMTSLSAIDIPEQKFENSGLGEHSIIIQATGDGVDNTLMIGGTFEGDEEKYYAKKGDSDNIYLITKEQKEKLDKTIADLR